MVSNKQKTTNNDVYIELASIKGTLDHECRIKKEGNIISVEGISTLSLDYFAIV